MASIRKRGTSYAVLYRDRTGRQTSESFSRRRDAERRKSEVEVELRAGTYIAPREARVTFETWYRRWEATRQVSATRKATDDGRRDKYVLPRWGDTPLDAITHMEAQAWVADLGRKLAPATVRGCFRLLKMPLDAAAMDGKIRVNPVLGVRMPPLRNRPHTADEVLTAAELTRLINKMPERWRALVFVLGWLGPRWSEAMGLRVCDVDFLRKQVYVGRVTVVEPDCRTLLIKDEGKTETAFRTVPLPAVAAEVLAQHVERFVPDASPRSFLFLTPAGTHPRRSNFRRIFDRALRDAGLADRGMNMKQLRHTAASLMLDAGLPLQDVQQRLGHSRPSTTYDFYAHLLTSRQETGTKALDEAMRSVAG